MKPYAHTHAQNSALDCHHKAQSLKAPVWPSQHSNGVVQIPSPHISALRSTTPAGRRRTVHESWDGTAALRGCKLDQDVEKEQQQSWRGEIKHRWTWASAELPPGCVAPKDWSICSIVGAMAWELKCTPLKQRQHHIHYHSSRPSPDRI